MSSSFLTAQDQRLFYNSEKTQSFTASLKSYDFGQKTVNLILESGKAKNYSFADISRDCVEYVLSMHELRSDSGGVRVAFVDVKKKAGKYKISRGFEIKITNQGEVPMTQLTLNYMIFYNQGDLKKKESQLKVKKGSVAIKNISGGEEFTANTSHVDLVRIMLPPSVGCGGYYRPGGRRVDKMIGIIVEILDGDVVLRREASNPKLLMSKDY